MRSLSIRRRWGVIAVMALAVVPLAIAVPTGAAGPVSKTAVVPLGGQVACRLHDPQPTDPLEMNTVAAAGLFKTVAMAKELFDCQAAGARTVAKDLETFIEIVQDAKRVIELRVELAHCTKDFAAGTVKCVWSKPDLFQLPTPIAGCDPTTLHSPPDPVVMNTAVAGVIKTIKVEKEIMQCGAEIGDLYTFTEIIEARTALASGGFTFRPIIHRFLGVMCFKQVQQADINRCARFNPGA